MRARLPRFPGVPPGCAVGDVSRGASQKCDVHPAILTSTPAAPYNFGECEVRDKSRAEEGTAEWEIGGTGLGHWHCRRFSSL